MTSKTHIVRIGNSKGVRIPKALLDQAQLPEEVELIAAPGRITVRAARRPRDGWESAARTMRVLGDDRPLDGAPATRFDQDEWEWR